VALYKKDRSLQLEKEGFAEMRADAENMLAVHVTHRAKMLVRRELALEVTWPGTTTPAASAAPSAEHKSSSVRSAALIN